MKNIIILLSIIFIITSCAKFDNTNVLDEQSPDYVGDELSNDDDGNGVANYFENNNNNNKDYTIDVTSTMGTYDVENNTFMIQNGDSFKPINIIVTYKGHEYSDVVTYNLDKTGVGIEDIIDTDFTAYFNILIQDGDIYLKDELSIKIKVIDDNVDKYMIFDDFEDDNKKNLVVSNAEMKYGGDYGGNWFVESDGNGSFVGNQVGEIIDHILDSSDGPDGNYDMIVNNGSMKVSLNNSKSTNEYKYSAVVNPIIVNLGYNVNLVGITGISIRCKKEKVSLGDIYVGFYVNLDGERIPFGKIINVNITDQIFEIGIDEMTCNLKKYQGVNLSEGDLGLISGLFIANTTQYDIGIEIDKITIKGIDESTFLGNNKL